jgi:hypothetical protein
VLVVVIHATALDALQLQPVPAVTLTLPFPPAEANEALVAESEYVHATPAWLTVKICPAMVSVPLREVVAVLAATT